MENSSNLNYSPMNDKLDHFVAENISNNDIEVENNKNFI